MIVAKIDTLAGILSMDYLETHDVEIHKGCFEYKRETYSTREKKEHYLC